MKKILVIDDVKNNLILIRSVLLKQFKNYQIILASSGEEGLKIAKKELPCTILLDIFMPDIDGFEVCRLLKTDEPTKKIPILMISAFGHDTKVRVKGLNAGADAIITKPFHMEELIALVNVMLRIKKAEDLMKEQNKDLEHTITKLKRAERIQKKNLTQIRKYQKKLKKLNSELIITEEKERKSIAGYLHDGIGQTLSIAHIRLTSLLYHNIDPKTKKTIKESSKLIDTAITESRLLTYDLSPPILYELGLIPAIKWKLDQIQEKGGHSSVFSCEEKELILNTDSLILVYRIICELLLNIVKHANANLIKVVINSFRRNYHIIISDNGVGFNYKKVSSLNKSAGYGLFSINERIDSINGEFNIKSDTNSGTKAEIIVPY
jgi:two-component system, sensor histidine kinase and response regulator